MIALWYVQAGKYNVLPLDSRGTQRLAEQRPQLARERNRYVYYPHTSAIPENVAVKILNRPHTITARVDIQPNVRGVIVSHGGSSGGYSLFIQDGKLHYVHNYVGAKQFRIESKEPLPEGEAEIRFQFQPSGEPELAQGKGVPGKASLFVNGKQVGEGEIPVTMPLLLSLGEGLTCGRDECSPVSELYQPPFEFTGTIHDVAVDVSGAKTEDKEAETRTVMGRQ